MNQTRSTRPAPVRIADLVAPEYPEEIGAAFEMLAEQGIDYGPDVEDDPRFGRCSEG